MCKINESNIIVVRATAFDIKKGCDKKVPFDVTADFHLANKISSHCSGNFEHSNTYHHLFTQDLSVRYYTTQRRPIWQYLWHMMDSEVRLWQFGLDDQSVIRCFQDEMISPPFEYE